MAAILGQHLPAFVPAGTPFADAQHWSVEASGTRRGDVALFGAALDLTESFRRGAYGGPEAVREMSGSLEAYSPVLDRDVQDLTALDLGDVRLPSDMESALRDITAAMIHASSLGDLAVMIGGEHTVSLAGYRGIKSIYPDAMLVQFDAHLDLRAEYEGRAVTHASWVFHAGQELGFENVVQLGVRSGERDEWRRARELALHSSEDLHLPAAVLERLRGRPIYLTVDIDVLDPAAAPGTGCPEPGGPSFREVERALHALRDLHVVAFDVVEVFPSLDRSGITAAAAAKLIREAMLMFSSAGRTGVPGS